ncbi:DNA mismatch repair protein MutT [Cypionkella aquatica]|uniref:DNA mismatch repair protein MutT n=1 Tax=Cypionkella aquatica TaxID=1756042 RepID=A0AA37TUV2_9RHOB|nr:NUDIX hydrolase [Cypionkella aquatica]GLS86265.1 DNA mismatch repair protein MutT [Cypionkella aquatica]
MDFRGCKAALLCRDALLTYLRDDKPGLPWPATWDLPGGGREAGETPEECLLRELYEEFGLRLPPARLILREVWPSMIDPAQVAVFFAGHITPAEIAAIRFGDEGQYWQMMPVEVYLAHPQAIPELQRRVAAAVAVL